MPLDPSAIRCECGHVVAEHKALMGTLTDCLDCECVSFRTPPKEPDVTVADFVESDL